MTTKLERKVKLVESLEDTYQSVIKMPIHFAAVFNRHTHARHDSATCSPFVKEFPIPCDGNLNSESIQDALILALANVE